MDKPEPSAEEVVVSDLFQSVVAEALAALPDKHREVVTLVDIDGLGSHPDPADRGRSSSPKEDVVMIQSMLSRSGCLRVTRVLQSHLDDEVDESTSAIVAKHLKECRRCGLEASTYRAIKSAITQAGPDVAPVDAATIERLRRFTEDLSEPQA